AYGISLREFLNYTTVLYYKFLEPTVKDEPSSAIFDSTIAFKELFAPAHAAKSLSILSATSDELAARLLGSPRQSWANDFVPLSRTPLIQISKDKYVCPDLHMFRDFFIRGD